jgi:ribonuclease BN (tRNA processing enzyme)
MNNPYFPVTIHPFPLNHPQVAVGYRIECNGAVIVYATDYEHGNERLDRTLRDYAANADVLICDAQFTPEENPQFRGWGHSTWLNAIQVGRDAGVGRVVLLHHDPSFGTRHSAGTSCFSGRAK